jgi:cytochrome c oxidase assembly factor CtaG
MVRRSKARAALIAVPLALLWTLRLLICAAVGGVIAWAVGVAIPIGISVGFVVGWIVQEVIFRRLRHRAAPTR